MEGDEDSGNNNNVEVHIPDEIVIDEILSRLPIKSLYRFRSVRKSWCYLPYNSKFVALHNKRYVAAPTVIILSYEAAGDHSILSFYSFDISEKGITTTLLATTTLQLDLYFMEPSCNGLICFSSSVGQDIYVCNPSTHQLLQLPKVPLGDFGLNSPSWVFGFGFDEASKKYKVLCLCARQELYNDYWKCFIYTVGSIDSNWSQLDDIPYRIQPMHGAYINGAVHWLFENDSYVCLDGILAFSFADEKWRHLPLPNCEEWSEYNIL